MSCVACQPDFPVKRPTDDYVGERERERKRKKKREKERKKESEQTEKQEIKTVESLESWNRLTFHKQP